MTKAIILSILLVLVYQFDELMHMVFMMFKRFRHKRAGAVFHEIDHYVGTALTIALMPLSINYVLLSDWELSTKMLVLFLTYAGFAVAAAGVGRIVQEMERAKKYGGLMSAIAVTQVVGGMIHPVLHQVPWRASRERVTYAKLAFLLSLPPLLGLIFTRIYDTYLYDHEFLEYINVLIIVMVGGLFINFTIRALEKYFARVNMSVMGYYRIVLGITVALFMML